MAEQRQLAALPQQTLADESTALDDDFALALRLQEQLDLEAELEAARQHSAGQAKVRLVVRTQPRNYRAHEEEDDEEEEDAEEEEEEEADEEEAATRRHRAVLVQAGPSKQHHQVSKLGGRQPKPNPTALKKVAATKHDPERAGRKNAERLQVRRVSSPRAAG